MPSDFELRIIFPTLSSSPCGDFDDLPLLDFVGAGFSSFFPLLGFEASLLGVGLGDSGFAGFDALLSVGFPEACELSGLGVPVGFSGFPVPLSVGFGDPLGFGDPFGFGDSDFPLLESLGFGDPVGFGGSDFPLLESLLAFFFLESFFLVVAAAAFVY